LSKKIIYFKINNAPKFVTLHFNFKVDATKIHSSIISIHSDSIFTDNLFFSKSGGTLLQQWIVFLYFQIFPKCIWHIFFFNWRLHLFSSCFFNFKMVLPTTKIGEIKLERFGFAGSKFSIDFLFFV
jgi:hypothetical protein